MDDFHTSAWRDDSIHRAINPVSGLPLNIDPHIPTHSELHGWPGGPCHLNKLPETDGQPMTAFGIFIWWTFVVIGGLFFALVWLPIMASSIVEHIF